MPSTGHPLAELNIEFPVNHDKQEKLADGFRDLSDAEFNCSVGEIDGILIWIECPTKQECIAISVLSRTITRPKEHSRNHRR